jgi:PAS domain S-box
MDDLLYVLDADGTLSRWNSRVTEVTGYAAAELDGANPLEFFSEAHRERVADALEATLADEDITVEADLLTATGRRIPYEFTGARLTDEAGHTTGVIGIGRDVTDRRARERQLEALTNGSSSQPQDVIR